MSDADAPRPESRDPLPNRFTRSTALGCLGLLGIFALPGYLLLPLEDWHLPTWLTQSGELAAFAALAGGVWLLARVPSTARAAADAWHPLTQAGRVPLREQPATAANRAMLALVGALAIVAAVGYVTAGTAARQATIGAGIAVVGVTGFACAALGVSVAMGRLPTPAWTWIRAPIRHGPRPRGLALALFGGAVAAWALLAAAGIGYTWGKVGLAALILGSVLLPAVIARWPRG